MLSFLVPAPGMTSSFRRLLADEAGQDLIEYALLSTLIGLCAIVAWGLIENAIASTYGGYDTSVNSLWHPDPPSGGS
jgi:Flp pilus assembly pilin Flp